MLPARVLEPVQLLVGAEEVLLPPLLELQLNLLLLLYFFAV